MLVKEEKYSNKDLIYKTNTIERNNHNFIILDDKTYEITKEVQELFNLINEYNYNVDVIDIKETAKLIVNDLKNRDFNTIVTIGTGGKQVYNSVSDDEVFKDKNIYLMKWNRVWDKDKSLGFDTNMDDFDLNNKNIILFEDVIASGNTLFTVKKEIEKRGGNVSWIYSSLIQESSPLIEDSFCNTTSVVVISSPLNKSLDPFWYPPIYSLRHILYGDEEMNSFYETLNEKYFNNEEKIEQYIKKLRR